jgi:hypothetical protein
MGDGHLDRLTAFAEGADRLGCYAVAFCFYGIDVPAPARAILAPFHRYGWLCGNADLGDAKFRAADFPQLTAMDTDMNR